MASAGKNDGWSRRLAGRALGRYIRLVVSSSRPVAEPADWAARIEAEHPAILAFWHGQFLPIPALSPPTVPTRIMVARHGDAEILSEALKSFPHLDLVRGAGSGSRAKDRGGAAALRGALRALEDGYSFAMTADVPPGPARKVGAGIIALARLSGRPILPCAVATSRFKALDTWSRLTVNLPYGRLGIALGEPIRVPREADAAEQERLRLAVEAALTSVTVRAYALAGSDAAKVAPAPPEDPQSPPARPGLSLKTYRAISRLARPLAPLVLSHRERRGKEDAARRGERLGLAARPRPDGPLLWLHAASVGEATSVLRLIEELGRARPDLTVLLTTGTRTSAELAARRLPAHALHQYVPLDSPAFMARFLDHWRPDVVALTESEIWPNLVLETAARAIPLVLVNGRLSGRSYGRWKKNRGLSRPLFNRFDLVLAQNEKLARRFADLGARRTRDVGNLKVDAPPPPVDSLALATLREAIGRRPVLIAASTHDGEEQIVAAAQRQLAREIDGLLTIIAPRHPERGPQVAALLAGLGLKVRQRSLDELPRADTDVYVADTMGELGTLYSLAPIAFVGGSLVDKGGQNPIEAARLGAVVLTGPHWQNFQDAYRALLRHQGAIEVASAEDIVAAVKLCLGSEPELTRRHAGAQAALASLSGALDRTLAALLSYLPPPAAADAQGLLRAS